MQELPEPLAAKVAKAQQAAAPVNKVGEVRLVSKGRARSVGASAASVKPNRAQSEESRRRWAAGYPHRSAPVDILVMDRMRRAAADRLDPRRIPKVVGDTTSHSHNPAAVDNPAARRNHTQAAVDNLAARRIRSRAVVDNLVGHRKRSRAAVDNLAARHCRSPAVAHSRSRVRPTKPVPARPKVPVGGMLRSPASWSFARPDRNREPDRSRKARARAGR